LRKALEVLAADSTVVHQKSNAVAHIWIESPLDGKAVSKDVFYTSADSRANCHLARNGVVR
jgi:hypothetical protein